MKPVVTFFSLLCLPFLIPAAWAQDVFSPDKQIKISIQTGTKFQYSVFYQNQLILSPSTVDMIFIDGKKLSDKPSKPKVTTRSMNEIIKSPVPEKRKLIPDIFNEITFRFSNSFGVIFRVYNDGVAYRITTAFKDSIFIQNEKAEFNFPDNPKVYFPEVARRGNQDKYHTSFEEPYQIKPLDSVTVNNLCFTPLLIAPANSPKIVITESDLEEYPGMFLTGTSKNSLVADFAGYPKKEEVLVGEFSQVFVSERENFIAKTAGTRAFPWRVLLIAPEDKDLPGNDLIYRLASPSRVSDMSWIEPRQSTEEWIITSNIFNVPFKSGINTKT